MMLDTQKPSGLVVIHLVGVEIPPDRIAVLNAVAKTREPSQTHLIVQKGRVTTPGISPDVSVVGLWKSPSRTLSKLISRHSEGCEISLHVWSSDWKPQWILPVADRVSRVLVDASLYRIWENKVWKCANAELLTFDERPESAGAVFGNVHQLSSSADRACIESVDVAEVRRRLRVEPEQCVVGVVPPMTKASGGFVGMWASLLVAFVHPRIRVLLAGGGREAERAFKLATVAGRADIAKFDAFLEWHEVLAVSDIFIDLHKGAVDRQWLAWLLATGKPMLLAEMPSDLSEENASRVWVPQSCEPKDVAKGLMKILDQGVGVQKVEPTDPSWGALVGQLCGVYGEAVCLPQA